MKDEEPGSSVTKGNSSRTASSASPDPSAGQSRQHSATPTTSGPPRSVPEWPTRSDDQRPQQRAEVTTKGLKPGTKMICKLRPQEEAHLVPDKHKVHPPDISNKRLALLGKMAAEKNSVLEWIDEEPSSSSAAIQSVDHGPTSG